MPFPFSEICTLFSRLEDIELHDPPILVAAEKSAHVKEITESWFRSHRRQLNELDIDSSVALLSTLLPERRTARVYGIQSTRLCRMLCRGLNLRSEYRKDLEAHRQPGKGDLAVCLERVLRSGGGPPASPMVDLTEVDTILDTLAGNCRFSDRETRVPPSSSEERDQSIGNVFKRLDSTQSKWLVRLILKDFSPIRINEHLVLRSFHFLLPDILRFQNDLKAAIQLLKGPLKEYPDSPDPRSQRLFRKAAAGLLEPAVGIKVGRPTFLKARSVDNCMSMCGAQRWILERKYDGEYCEIHIDLDRSATVSECITMFSKSGKDSTEDRKDLIPTLVDCLHLAKPTSKIKRRVILLGELVVYSTEDRGILSFEKVRKHVTRSGIFLGTNEDSQPHAHEHVAIVFFDLLLLDDEIVMRRPLEQRRMWLREVYTKLEGRAMGAEWKIVDFSDPSRARKTLIQQFAASIAARHEGLVLKPCDLPYFSLEPATQDATSAYIKLKKDYIAGMGDEAHVAVIGGSYNSQQALKSTLPNLKWTDFHLGCLLNKSDVLRFDARPRFKLVGTIQAEHCIPAPILEAANTIGNFCAQPHSINAQPASFDIEDNPAVRIDTIFTDPFVFEVLGSGFEKPSNSNFFMLRHPRVKKLHQDRTWKDCVSMQELQEQGAATRAAPVDSESQETRRLIDRLEAKCKKRFERLCTTTPPSASTKSNKTPTSATAVARGGYQRTQIAKVQTTASTDSKFNGTTLVDTSANTVKRSAEALEETPCPVAKRPRLKQPTNKSGRHHRQHSKYICDRSFSTRTSSPLADITNTAPLGRSSPAAAVAVATAAISNNTNASTSAMSKPKRQQQQQQQPTPPTSSNPVPIPTNQIEPKFTTSTCNICSSVIYATPCISRTPYITQDLLLSAHNDVLLIPSLSHWNRDAFAHAPMAETVSESQAYAGMRKIVLVEGRRKGAVETVVREVLALNQGKWRERAEVWDWRVLEERGVKGHFRGFDGGGGGLEAAAGIGIARHFLGEVIFDEELDRTIFVRNETTS